jgi:uncharacterized circularly permuted ATP-grasp superfamily protein
VEFDAYDLAPTIYDEMFLPDGAPRKHCRPAYETLNEFSAGNLASIHERVNRSFSNEGITFTVYGDEGAGERNVPIDCIPRLMSGSDWGRLEAGLAQRLRTLNLFLQDVYGESRIKDNCGEPRIVHDGVIPADVVMDCPQYRRQMRGFAAPCGVWVAVCGTDLVRTNDGFMVLEDNLRVPSGVSYCWPTARRPRPACAGLYRSMRVREVEHYGQALLATLRELSPRGTEDPSIAVLTPGVYNSAFYEHVFLAHELGAELGRDATCWSRTTWSICGPPPGCAGLI